MPYVILNVTQIVQAKKVDHVLRKILEQAANLYLGKNDKPNLLLFIKYKCIIKEQTICSKITTISVLFVATKILQ